MKLKQIARKACMMLAAAAVTGGMTAACWAAVPQAADTQTIEVTGIEHGAVVRAYKVAEASYTSAGLQKYQTVSGISIADLEHPTLAELDTIVGKINTSGDGFDPEAVSMTDTDGGSGTAGSGECTYQSGQLPAGMYVVLVRGTNGNIYNPMIVSIGYNEDSELVAGSLNADTDFVDGAVTQAKHTRVDADKVIVNKGTAAGSAGTGIGHGDTVHVGDTVQYRITADIPAYDKKAYENVTYTAKDTLSSGQKNNRDLTVSTATGTLQTPADYTVDYSGQVMTVTFKPAWVLAHPTEKVTMRYSVEVLSGAVIGFAGNPNDLELTYSNDPNSGSTEKITDRTDFYSFAFTARKVDSAMPEVKIAGAEFKLTGGSIPAEGMLCTTGSDGELHFSGLDAGEYTLVETKAPKGYATNDRVYKVTIAPSLGEEQAVDSASYAEGAITKTNSGRNLLSYTVTIKDGNDVIGTATYTKNPEGEGAIVANIPNTRFQNLPATGGSGTVLLTSLGVIGVIAVTLYAMRRRSAEEEA